MGGKRQNHNCNLEFLQHKKPVYFSFSQLLSETMGTKKREMLGDNLRVCRHIIEIIV